MRSDDLFLSGSGASEVVHLSVEALLQGRRPLADAPVPARQLDRVAFSPDGRSVATTGDRYELLRFDRDHPQPQRFTPFHQVIDDIAFDPAGRSLYVQDSQGHAVIIDGDGAEHPITTSPDAVDVTLFRRCFVGYGAGRQQIVTFDRHGNRLGGWPRDAETGMRVGRLAFRVMPGGERLLVLAMGPDGTIEPIILAGCRLRERRRLPPLRSQFGGTVSFHHPWLLIHGGRKGEVLAVKGRWFPRLKKVKEFQFALPYAHTAWVAVLRGRPCVVSASQDAVCVQDLETATKEAEMPLPAPRSRVDIAADGGLVVVENTLFHSVYRIV